MKFILLLSLMTLGISLQLKAREIEIIKEHSKIAFDIDYMLMTKVQGQFKDYHGTLNINEDKGEIYNIKVIALANSIDTNDGKRDFHLKGMEFFQATNYPEVLFESRGPFKFSPQKKFSVTGNLTIRGIKRPIILETVFKGKLKDPWNKENYFFELEGVLDRKSYSMVWNKKMDNGGVLIGDQVHINITVQAQSTGDKTPFSTHMIPSSKGIIERDQLKRGLIKKLTTSTDPNDYPPKK
ncbi:MAG: YceI family protein [Bacteriovorax sp.]|nr:YceI family protein [Bacteriovorax sp.]